MKRWYRARLFWLTLAVIAIPCVGLFLLRQSTHNVMHPALDKLAAISFEQRWSHPEILRIRGLGKDAVTPLRAVLREKDKPTTRFLLWLKTKWAGVVRYVPNFPDPAKMRERRATACQVFQILGPAARPAVPELVNILAGKDSADVNAAVMALHAIGIDAPVCERLNAALEAGPPEFNSFAIISALGGVKPPSPRTLHNLTGALKDPSLHIQREAAEMLGQLGTASSVIVTGLKGLQTSTNDFVALTASTSLWQLEKETGAVFENVMRVLENQLRLPSAPPIGGGNGGQGVDATEQMFMKGADLFQKMRLVEPDNIRALDLLNSFCEKSDRIFVRMLLLPSMADLGWPADDCLAVCRTGLRQEEIYYRIQAAGLVAMLQEKYSLTNINAGVLIQDQEVGVRVYGARVHWRIHHDANVVVPVLAEALDRTKHQSYYYAEILPVALKALGEIGPEAQGAVSALDPMRHDPNPVIAKLTTATIEKIRKQPTADRQ
jgi:hypothetical protein